MNWKIFHKGGGITQPYRSLQPAYLRKHGIERVDFDIQSGRLVLRCLVCGYEWEAIYNMGRGLPRGFWRCPDERNHPQEAA